MNDFNFGERHTIGQGIPLSNIVWVAQGGEEVNYRTSDSVMP